MTETQYSPDSRKMNAIGMQARPPYFRISMTKGELIRLWRMYKGLTQEELAAAAGIDDSTISQIENSSPKKKGREPRIDTLKKIATGLGITVQDLSHAPPSDVTLPEESGETFDLRAWLSDPDATFEGSRVSEKDKALIEALFLRLAEREKKEGG